MKPCTPTVRALDPTEAKRRLERIAEVCDREIQNINGHLVGKDLDGHVADWFGGMRDAMRTMSRIAEGEI